MKKTYLPKHKIFFSAEHFSCGAYALIAAIFLCLIRILFPNFFWHIFSPVFYTSDAIAQEYHSVISGFGNAQRLTIKNEVLIQKNTELANENQILIQKVADISGLSCKSDFCSSAIYAGVVARPPESPYDILVLAAGSNDGVKVGMEAFGGEGTPIGVVSAVLENFSRVVLFSSPRTATNGWFGNKKLPITLYGAGAGAIKATMPRSANSAVGDIVFVSGPGALPIGVIGSVDSDPSSPAVELHIVPAVNLFSTTWVLLRDAGVPVSISATTTPL